jgi:hypothetical protein
MPQVRQQVSATVEFLRAPRWRRAERSKGAAHVETVDV